MKSYFSFDKDKRHDYILTACFREFSLLNSESKESYIERAFNVYERMKQDGEGLKSLIFIAMLWEQKRFVGKESERFEMLSRYTEALAINGYADISKAMGESLHRITIEEGLLRSSFHKEIESYDEDMHSDIPLMRGYLTALDPAGLFNQAEKVIVEREMLIWSFAQRVNHMVGHPVVSELEAVVMTKNNAFRTLGKDIVAKNRIPRRKELEKRDSCYHRALSKRIFGK